jgi:hypothetical protein
MILENADLLGERTASEIRGIFEASYPRARELRGELRAARRRMRQLLAQESPDRSAVLEQVERVGQLQTALHKHRVATLLEVRSRLTPEQRAQLMQRRRARRGGGPGPLRRVCAEDVARYCASAAPGLELRRCLRSQEPESLSQGCRERLARPRGGALPGAARDDAAR